MFVNKRILMTFHFINSYTRTTIAHAVISAYITHSAWSVTKLILLLCHLAAINSSAKWINAHPSSH